MYDYQKPYNCMVAKKNKNGGYRVVEFSYFLLLTSYDTTGISISFKSFNTSIQFYCKH